MVSSDFNLIQHDRRLADNSFFYLSVLHLGHPFLPHLLTLDNTDKETGKNDKAEYRPGNKPFHAFRFEVNNFTLQAKISCQKYQYHEEGVLNLSNSAGTGIAAI